MGNTQILSKFEIDSQKQAFMETLQVSPPPSSKKQFSDLK